MASQLFPPNMPFYQDQQAFHANPYPTVAAVAAAPLASAMGEVKAHKRTCSVAGCKNGIVQGGLCVAHGAKRRKCGFPGCTKSSKCAGMCSKHGPPRKPCDTKGCTKISVRGSKCKEHAAPSSTCIMVGCRKVAAVGGMCKRHQHQVESGEIPLKAGAGFVPIFQPSLVPHPYMLSQMNCFSSSDMCQVIAAQNMFPGMGMTAGLVPAMHPSMFGVPLSYVGHFANPAMGAMGYGGGVNPHAPMMGTMRGQDVRNRNPTAEALMMLGVSK
ncbi:hypothetical protein HJC23_011712 [Cyclotella cryptica]|uniref:WRKY19-like zinc finger domain-containing protein n=1 Tax=Cyclotella cryptica TaxID=29204 RepID=A0ABD3QRE4_9STRA|eukprot:CCRYP_004824-RA/>CCRYP_004824-RA protein AED:0.00 eAED:0.00 QI:132/1/1/1/1/1/2/233/269